MSDLAEFVKARLAEDEELARDAYQGNFRWYGEEEAAHLEESDDPVLYATLEALTKADARHIVEHGPERVLREVEAKRDILARYEDCLARQEDPDYPSAVARDQAREYEDFVLPNLAAGWSDHPDYTPDMRA
ncbi:MAG: DUF6221 family protein [Actinomycetota bacterium]|nr:DUF6221 family protein [Actinomycetota bacterium]